MKDYIKRFLIVGIMAFFISLLFFGGRLAKASELTIQDLTNHWIWPTDGMITDTFGTRHGKHYGIDIAGKIGTPVTAVDNGIVTKSYYSDSYGNVIFIKHDNQFETVYAHLNKRYVNRGDHVKQGETIGEMGTTGHSSGSHLHFEVHKNEWTINKENAVNPMEALGVLSIGETVQAAKQKQTMDKTLATVGIVSASEEEKEPSFIIHIVKRGENLTKLAKKYETTISSIQKLNGMKDDKIYIRQQLKIPANKENVYIVQPKDTLTSIAKRTNTTVSDLMKKNGLKTDKIFVEQKLRIK